MTAIAAWTEDFAGVVAQIGPRFARSEARAHAAAYLRGLAGPRRAEERLAAGRGGGRRDPLRPPAVPLPRDLGPGRGARRPAGLRGRAPGRPARAPGGRRDRLPQEGRQVGGRPARSTAATAGRTANARSASSYLRQPARAHLPRPGALPAGSWTDDRARCRAAGIPDDVAFATKPALAQALLERALEAGVPAAWVTADSIYGDVKYLRVWLEARPIGYVLAVSRKDTVAGPDWRQRRIAATSPPRRPRAGSG